MNIPNPGTAALCLLALAAACATATTDTTSPAAAPEAAEPPATTPATTSADYNPADARFLQGMIPHHAQALVMTELVAERTNTEGVRLMAERIAVSQGSEISLMQSWLRDHGASVPAGEPHRHGGGMLMPGMLTQTQIDDLAASSGSDFDRLFLAGMIQHHQGAITMVEELFGTPGAGQGSAIYHIAAEIDATQRAEIARMRRVLATLPPASSGR
jgi:uncharacterized protein (DUF305 family)